MSNQTPQFRSYLGLQKIVNSSHQLQTNINQMLDQKFENGVKKPNLIFKILDTFFSDTLDIKTLENIFGTVNKLNCNIQLLILNPYSKLAKSRAAALNKSATFEINNALYNIRCSLGRGSNHDQHLDRDDKQGFEKEEHINVQLEKIREQNNQIIIKFYDCLTESPVYIFSPYVFKGLILHQLSAAENPWLCFIDDESQHDDIFKSLDKNFDRIWKAAKPIPIQ